MHETKVINIEDFIAQYYAAQSVPFIIATLLFTQEKEVHF
jgi:hypothetical protein